MKMRVSNPMTQEEASAKAIDQARSIVNGLYKKTIPLNDAVKQFDMLPIPYVDIAREVFDRGDIAPKEQLVYRSLDDRLNSPIGKRGIKVVCELLARSKLAFAVFFYMQGEASKGQSEWLKGIVNRMPMKDLARLIADDRFDITGTEIGFTFKQRVLVVLDEIKRPEIIHRVKKLGGLADLYRMTGWKDCIDVADGYQRGKMLGSDLEL